MRLKVITLLIILYILFESNILGCHKGGPMGFATNDPGGFSLDITLSPTYTGASTLGTLNCKNWDYAKYKKNNFLNSQWRYLNEEASKGEGENLVALSQIMGCEKKKQKNFSNLIQKNYAFLFDNHKSPENFLEKLEILISKNQIYYCSG